MPLLLSAALLCTAVGCGPSSEERASLFVAQHLVGVFPAEEGRIPYLAPEREILGTPKTEVVPPRSWSGCGTSPDSPSPRTR